MSRFAVTSPFHVLSNAAIAALPWAISLSSKPYVRTSNIASEWDSQTDLTIRREIRYDQEQALVDLDYSDSTLELQLTVYRGTGYGLIARELLAIHKCRVQPNKPIVVTHVISSQDLAGSLHLRSEITLVSASADAGPLSPVEVGARLWSDDFRIPLEAEEPRFPIELASFNSQFPSESFRPAPWYLWSAQDDPARSLSSALRLYINSDCEVFCERVKTGDPETLRQLMAGVMTQTILNHLDTDHDDQHLDWPAGSIGAQATEWRKLAFPNETLLSLRAIANGQFGVFSAAVLAAAEFVEEYGK